MQSMVSLRRLCLIFTCVSAISLQAANPVKFLYDTEFSFWFDNREFDHTSLDRSQTLFGVRLSPEIGIGISDSVGGTHRLMAGVQYIQPIGNDFREAKVLPTVYYEYGIKGFSAHLGAIPYTHLIEPLPDLLMSDSINYFHPNIQGALFQYRSSKGFAEVLCDWRGLWTPNIREAFRVVGNGRYQYQWFFVGGMAQMNHLANYAPPTPAVGVCDDLVFYPYLGVNLGGVTPLDSFSLRAGYVCSIERDRAAEKTYIPQGGMLELYLNWRFLGLKNTLYYGDCQMPLYAKYGSVLNQGDAMMQARFYDKAEIFAYMVRNSFVSCYAACNLLFIDGSFNTQQRVVAQFRLSGIKDYKHKKKLRDWM